MKRRKEGRKEGKKERKKERKEKRKKERKKEISFLIVLKSKIEELDGVKVFLLHHKTWQKVKVQASQQEKAEGNSRPLL
jgi:hypothetical protein